MADFRRRWWRVYRSLWGPARHGLESIEDDHSTTSGDRRTRNGQGEALNRLLQDRKNVLFSEVMSALSEARADAAFENSREYRELVVGLSDIVSPD